MCVEAKSCIYLYIYLRSALRSTYKALCEFICVSPKDKHSRWHLKAAKLSPPPVIRKSVTSQLSAGAYRDDIRTSDHRSVFVADLTCVAAMNCLRALRLSNSVQLIVKNTEALKKLHVLQPACCLSAGPTPASQRPQLDHFHLKMWVFVCVWWTAVSICIHTRAPFTPFNDFLSHISNTFHEWRIKSCFGKCKPSYVKVCNCRLIANLHI